MLQTDERSFLEVPDKGNPWILVEDGAREGNSLPVEKGVDDVWLNAADIVLPGRDIEIPHVAEWERADVVVPIGVRHPETKELVPPLLEGQHPLRVVGQFPDQEDFQPVGRQGVSGRSRNWAKRSTSSMKLPSVE